MKSIILLAFAAVMLASTYVWSQGGPGHFRPIFDGADFLDSSNTVTIAEGSIEEVDLTTSGDPSGQGDVLTYDGTSGFTWATQDSLSVGSATNADNISVAATTAASTSVALFESATGNQEPKTNSGLVYDATNNVLTATDHITIGDDEYQMAIEGSAYTSRLAVATDSGDNTVAEIEAHRHGNSSNRGAVIYGVRSRGSIASESSVVSGDSLLTLYALGFDGTDQARAAEIDFTVGDDPGTDDMPGTIEFKTSADGSQVPTTRLTIDEDGLATFANNVTVSGTITGSLSGNATTASTANAGDDAADFFDAEKTVVQHDVAVTNLAGTGLSVSNSTLNASVRSVETFTLADGDTGVNLTNTPTNATAVSCAMTGYTLSRVASGPTTGQFSVLVKAVTLGLPAKDGDEVVCTYTYS